MPEQVLISPPKKLNQELHSLPQNSLASLTLIYIAAGHPQQAQLWWKVFYTKQGHCDRHNARNLAE